MEQKSPERARPKTMKIAFDSNPSKFERVFMAGDFNGCLLVVPDILGALGKLRFTKGVPQVSTLSVMQRGEEK